MRRQHPEWFKSDLTTLFQMLAEGRIAPEVAEILPLRDVRLAHDRVEAGTVPGKLILRVSE
ncbi:zinc-binding dehydrogenase [Yoonia sp.]|uniref:zinc-binding dehydrogenase n=1 Tax=Yoonia sp. TaxID=2212373 RepID=UPI00358FD21F